MKGDMQGEEIYGWVGKIVRVDLTERRIEIVPTAPYVPTFIGGRGIAAKIAWDEIPAGVGAFDPENVLMFFAGPLTGTTAPFSGRGTVCAVSPQAHPQEWFTRSGMGGHWAPELKYAGYDGIVITGQASEPVYLCIRDGEVEIRDAGHLWGLGAYKTQQLLMQKLGAQSRIVAIGQAGENLSRIAIALTETEAAAGQGGFGAVMGSKKLKAIAMRGTGGIRTARPKEFMDRCIAVAREAHGSHGLPKEHSLNPERAAKYGQKFHACSQQCSIRCADSRFYTHVPGRVCPRVYSGALNCVGPHFQGRKGTVYGWKLGFDAAFEVSRFANDYGLNYWDILLGLVPWLRACVEAGMLKDLDGLPIDLDRPEFWVEMLRRMAYREGMGDALAEGGRRAAELLGVGQELVGEFYPAWGFAGHWDGHGDHINRIFFPYWLVTALQWAMDSRDPLSSGHGFASNVMGWSLVRSPKEGLTWEELTAVGARVYGTEKAVDPLSGYEGKAVPAIWHAHRSVLKDSLLVDDQVFPRIFSKRTSDHFARADGIEGPSFEYHLFAPATGVDMQEQELYRACERVLNLERAILVRNRGRSREDDESVIPHFSSVENWVNPLLGEAQTLHPDRFRQLMDEYYTLRGWDTRTGRPSRFKLEELGLKEVADELEECDLLP